MQSQHDAGELSPLARAQLDTAKRMEQAQEVADMAGKLSPRALAQLADFNAAAQAVGHGLGEDTATFSIEVEGTAAELESPPAVAIFAALRTTEDWKPNDRSEQDKHYAVTLTMLRQAYAYFLTWAMVGSTGSTGSPADPAPEPVEGEGTPAA